MAEKTYNQFKGEVMTRYNSLTEDEKDMIRNLKGTQQGLIIARLLGNEMEFHRLGAPKNPAKKSSRRGLGTR